MSNDYKESENNEWIIDLVDIEDAVELALEINPDLVGYAYEAMYLVNEELDKDNEPWICVIGRCDICGQDMVFFAPVAIYENEIIGVECSNCGNMSVYPQERNSQERNQEEGNCDDE